MSLPGRVCIGRNAVLERVLKVRPKVFRLYLHLGQYWTPLLFSAVHVVFDLSISESVRTVVQYFVFRYIRQVFSRLRSVKFLQVRLTSGIEIVTSTRVVIWKLYRGSALNYEGVNAGFERISLKLHLFETSTLKFSGRGTMVCPLSWRYPASLLVSSFLKLQLCVSFAHTTG
jgi:hypothetical protein